jgi:hypothetical protein
MSPPNPLDLFGEIAITAIQLPADLLQGLQKIADIAGNEQAWWARRLLFIALRGRVLLEQIEPLKYRFCSNEYPSVGALQPVNFSASLIDLLEQDSLLASSSVQVLSEALLNTAVYGSRPAAANEVMAGLHNEDDASIKIWLPELIHEAVVRLATHWDLSSSDVLRNLLLEHLTGRLGYLRAIKNGIWSPRRRTFTLDDRPNIMFSRRARVGNEPGRRVAGIHLYGKSTVNLKLWCPFIMRQHLTLAAQERALPTSEYVREAVAQCLFGKFPSSALEDGA